MVKHKSWVLISKHDSRYWGRNWSSKLGYTPGVCSHYCFLSRNPFIAKKPALGSQQPAHPTMFSPTPSSLRYISQNLSPPHVPAPVSYLPPLTHRERSITWLRYHMRLFSCTTKVGMYGFVTVSLISDIRNNAWDQGSRWVWAKRRQRDNWYIPPRSNIPCGTGTQSSAHP